MVYWRGGRRYGFFRQRRNPQGRVVTARVTQGIFNRQEPHNAQARGINGRFPRNLRFGDFYVWAVFTGRGFSTLAAITGHCGRRLKQRVGLTALAKHSGIVYNGSRCNRNLIHGVREDVKKILADDAHEEAHCWNHAPEQCDYQMTRHHGQHQRNIRDCANCYWRKSMQLQSEKLQDGSTSAANLEGTDSMNTLITTESHEGRPTDLDRDAQFPADPPFEAISKKILSALPHLTLRNDDATTYAEAATGLIASALSSKGIGDAHTSTAADQRNNATSNTSMDGENLLQSFYNKTAPLNFDSSEFLESKKYGHETKEMPTVNSLSQLDASWLRESPSQRSSDTIHSNDAREIFSMLRSNSGVSSELSQSSQFSPSVFNSFEARYGGSGRNEAFSPVSVDVNDSVRPLDCDDLATPAPFAEIPPPLGSVHDECFFKDIIDIEPVQTNATNIFEHFEFENNQAGVSESYFTEFNDDFFASTAGSPNPAFFGLNEPDEQMRLEMRPSGIAFRVHFKESTALLSVN
uniref:Uncharacterized protein n=1 Tax=Ascaris lumbricoides TaxID=6252 RepID=A0A9J2P5E7_ASCLU